MDDPLKKSPFSALRSTHNSLDRILREGMPSRSGMWVGKIAHVWRDANQRARVSMLFDVEPLDNWPKGTDIAPLSSTGGEPVAVIPRVRCLQPLFGALDSQSTPTGNMGIPSQGSVVCVGEDTRGWVILGFYTGPIVAQDGSIDTNAEFSYNPGIEEVGNAALDNRALPGWFDLDEGDWIQGRNGARIRASKEGLYVGSDAYNGFFWRTDGQQRFERYVNSETRAPGYLGYHKTWLGASATTNADGYTRRTEVIESSPFVENGAPYFVKQRGFVSSDCLLRGRTAGETPTILPTDILSQFASNRFLLKRDTLVQPTGPSPNPPIPNDNDYATRGMPVYDFKVYADGSVTLQSGNSTKGLGNVPLAADAMDFKFGFDVPTGIFTIRIGPAAAPVFSLNVDKATGLAKFFAKGGYLFETPAAFLVAAATWGLTGTQAGGQSKMSVAGDLTQTIDGALNTNAKALATAAKTLSIKGDDAGTWDKAGFETEGTVKGSDLITTMGISVQRHQHVFGCTAPSAPIPSIAFAIEPAGTQVPASNTALTSSAIAVK